MSEGGGILRRGADVDPVDDHGQTPLMLAASHGDVACVRLLLEAGADPTRSDEEGKTAINHARKNHETWVSINKEPATETDGAEIGCVQRVVPAPTDEMPGLEPSSALPDDDRPCLRDLTAVQLYPAILRVGVATVLAGSLTLLMCH